MRYHDPLTVEIFTFFLPKKIHCCAFSLLAMTSLRNPWESALSLLFGCVCVYMTKAADEEMSSEFGQCGIKRACQPGQSLQNPWSCACDLPLFIRSVIPISKAVIGS